MTFKITAAEKELILKRRAKAAPNRMGPGLRRNPDVSPGYEWPDLIHGLYEEIQEIQEKINKAIDTARFSPQQLKGLHGIEKKAAILGQQIIRLRTL